MRPGNVNWSQIVIEIIKTGINAAAVAKHCYCTRSTVISWRDYYRSPKSYVAARRLLLLWQTRCNGNPDEPPYR